MGFTAGDVIMLLVVLAALFVFRQLDRGNRSLDKVKRYSDRVMQTLSTFVDGKSSEIKDLAIEVQVSLKQGKELLRTVREVQDELTARSRDLDDRSSEIEAIRSRIDGYDSALAELVNMSERVDDNLRRLRGEGERLRRVDEQRAALQERVAGFDSEVASLEGRLKQIESKAQDDLSDKLNSKKDAFFSNLDIRANDLTAQQEQWKLEMDGRLDSMQTEGAARIAEVGKALAEELQEQIEDLQRRSSMEIGSAASVVDGLEQQMTERLGSLDDQLSAIETRLGIFINQTPILERADRMQKTLEQLREQTDTVFHQQQEVVKFEVDFKNIKNLGEVVSSRLVSFEENRSRIESMERGIRGLLAASEETELKLADVEESRNKINEVQAKLKEINKLSEVVEARYQELAGMHEKAGGIIASSSHNVDLLRQVNKEVMKIRPEVTELAARLSEIQVRLDGLPTNKGGGDAVVSAQSGRNRGTSQLRLPIENRESVSKLAEQGWSSADIARATQLSQGEVEHILKTDSTADSHS